MLLSSKVLGLVYPLCQNCCLLENSPKVASLDCRIEDHCYIPVLELHPFWDLGSPFGEKCSTTSK